MKFILGLFVGAALLLGLAYVLSLIHILAGFEQRDRNVQSSRRLTRPAFLVAENDHVSGLTSLLDRLH